MASMHLVWVFVQWDYDYDPDLSWLDQWDEPEAYAGNEWLRDDGSVMPFEEYIDGPGDPDNHTTLEASAWTGCPKCRKLMRWDSLGNIDFLDWQNPATGVFRIGHFETGWDHQRGTWDDYQVQLSLDMIRQVPRVWMCEHCGAMLFHQSPV